MNNPQESSQRGTNRSRISDFYEELETASIHKQTCEITYLNPQGKEELIISPVRDLYTEDGVEYARLDDRTIRLERITGVNGRREHGKVDPDLLEMGLQPDAAPATEHHKYPEEEASFATQEQSRRRIYKSPNSDFYEELETASMHKQKCEILYQNAREEEVLVISPVYDLYSENGVEYAKLDNQVIRLDRLIGVNGRRRNGKVDPDLLEMGLQPDAAPATEHHKYPEEEAQIQGNAQINPVEEPIPAEQALRTEEDFVHRFLTTPPPFLIADTDRYVFAADRIHRQLLLKVKKPWAYPNEVVELGGYIERIAPLMGPEFTLLNDLTDIIPDESGTVWAQPVPNKGILLRRGLIKVADVVHPDCETLVHGVDSFSVNSVRLRYFKDIMAAQHWLTFFQEESNTDQAASA